MLIAYLETTDSSYAEELENQGTNNQNNRIPTIGTNSN